MKTIEFIEIPDSDEEEIKNDMEMLSSVEKSKLVESTVKKIQHLRRQNKRKMEKMKNQHSVEKSLLEEDKNQLEKDVKKLQNEVKSTVKSNNNLQDIAEQRKKMLETADNTFVQLINEKTALEQKIAELEKEITSTAGCPVCLEKFHRNLSPAKILPCHHVICVECWAYIFETSGYYSRCPVCRGPFFPDLYI